LSDARYREHTLAPPLDSLVACVWMLSQHESPGEVPEPQRIPPDGCVELIFHLGDRFAQIADGRERLQSDTIVVGVWTQPIAIVAPRTFDTVGVRIQPGCISAFCDEPATRFADTVTDATAIWGREISAVRDRLGAARSERDRVKILAAFLTARLRRRDPAIGQSIARIVATRGRQSIDHVVRQTGVGHRRLERAFGTHVGVSPKMLSRIVRFQHVLRHSRPETAGAWAHVAAACGYTDQSHLIRDFQQFTGTTPHLLATSERELADYFRRR
jgi:AraC-like DNA-binding protein